MRSEPQAAPRRRNVSATDLAVVSGSFRGHETPSRMRLEIDLVGTEGGASVRDEVPTFTPRQTGDTSEPIRLSPLDAGEGIVPFLHGLEGLQQARLPAALVSPDDAASVNAVLDAMALNRG